MAKKKVLKVNFWSEERDVIIQKHHFSKNFRMSVFYDGRIYISIPTRASFKEAEMFFWKKREWVGRMLLRNQREGQNEDRQERIFQDKKIYTKAKKEARKIIQKKIDYFNKWYGFNYEKIFIRKQRTRWGSCSGKNNLSFNVRIIFLPSHLQDYIVVHELCHLKEKNHSSRFWKLVERVMPDYKERRRELKKF